MPLTAEALMAIDLKPDELAEFLVSHLGAGIDLFALADLRTGSACASSAIGARVEVGLSSAGPRIHPVSARVRCLPGLGP